MSQGIEGKIVLITGASSGIGAVIAQLLVAGARASRSPHGAKTSLRSWSKRSSAKVDLLRPMPWT